jgi:hypothetical protein
MWNRPAAQGPRGIRLVGPHEAALAMIGVEGGTFGEVATTSEVVKRLA